MMRMASDFFSETLLYLGQSLCVCVCIIQRLFAFHMLQLIETYMDIAIQYNETEATPQGISRGIQFFTNVSWICHDQSTPHISFSIPITSQAEAIVQLGVTEQ